jgi:hypothetical protein
MRARIKLWLAQFSIDDTPEPEDLLYRFEVYLGECEDRRLSA